MPHVIWKFELTLIDEQTIMLVEDAQILTAQMQFGKLCLWVRLDPATPQEQRRIFVYGTGHSSHRRTDRYIGTVQVDSGLLVVHVFEEVRP